MRDEYPPFRLDTGGIDPGSAPAVPPVGPPDHDGELASVTADAELDMEVH
ncbi:MAG TPA: hypothetical protein VFW57_00150 [Acidimicrobiia bacterium]|nr:hypothetical protein [Acidimicrobiia bacterium]